MVLKSVKIVRENSSETTLINSLLFLLFPSIIIVDLQTAQTSSHHSNHMSETTGMRAPATRLSFYQLYTESKSTLSQSSLFVHDVRVLTTVTVGPTGIRPTSNLPFTLPVFSVSHRPLEGKTARMRKKRRLYSAFMRTSPSHHVHTCTHL